MTAGLILSDLFGFVVSIQFFATPLKREFLCFSPILFTSVAKTVKAKHNVHFIRQELFSAYILSYRLRIKENVQNLTLLSDAVETVRGPKSLKWLVKNFHYSGHV